MKQHGLAHNPTDVLKFGLMPNWDSPIFEGALGPLAHSAKHSKINLLNAAENCVKSFSGLNLGRHLNSKILSEIGASKKKLKTLKKFFFEKETETSDQFGVINGIATYKRTYYKNKYNVIEQITVDEYSSSLKTNNQFHILNIEGEEIYAQILIIETQTKKIYFKEANLFEKERISGLSRNRCVKVRFSNVTKMCEWNCLVEKVVGFKLSNDFYYLTKIWR